MISNSEVGWFWRASVNNTYLTKMIITFYESLKIKAFE